MIRTRSIRGMDGGVSVRVVLAVLASRLDTSGLSIGAASIGVFNSTTKARVNRRSIVTQTKTSSLTCKRTIHIVLLSVMGYLELHDRNERRRKRHRVKSLRHTAIKYTQTAG